MLKLKEIKKNYITPFSTVEALKGINLNFRRNEFVSILGPSGCGKTTMLNVVGGLDHYTTGDLVINGKSTKEYKDKDWDNYRNHSVGFVFQSYNLIPHQTVLENVEIALTLSGISKVERKKRAAEVLTRVGLADRLNVKPNQLSGGQMQRVAIARALVNNPEILLADEPTGALDTQTSVQILDLLKEIAKEKLVIMVTHNPELAKTYSTRIITLLDGEITSDSDPYEGEVYQKVEKEEPKTKKKGASMSFRTALALSFRNLLTKKTRSILVALAGSIGIVGIALILSLSSGFQAYIDKVQEDTLSTYPLMIEESSIDISSVFENIMNRDKTKTEHEDPNKIYTSTVMLEMFKTLMAGRYTNNLADFKQFLDNNESGIQNYVSDIKYSYNIDLQIYSSNPALNNLKVNPSTIFQDVIGDKLGELSSYGSDVKIFTEMINNQTLLNSQYDVVSGRWPSRYNELVLVLNSNNEISDYTLYALGIKNPSELEKILNKIMLGEEVTLEKDSYDYQQMLNTKFKLVLNTSYYKKTGLNLWSDVSSNDVELASLIRDGLELNIVGIIKPSENGVATSIDGSIGYLSSLTEYVINEINNTEIVKYQKANPEYDVLSGRNFEKIELSIPMIEAMIESPQFAAYKEPYYFYKELYTEEYGEEEGLRLLLSYFEEMFSSSNSYESNLKLLGVNDLSSPSMISLYPVDFAGKNEIIRIIDEYNQKQLSEQNENNVIQYTDYIGLLMSSVSDVINAITYVLVAFVAISLVVSSIMIGIITYISVLERTKEIGVLRSVGASKRDVSNVFNAETLIIGLIAGLLGIGITMLLNIPVNIIIKYLADISNVSKLPLLYASILVAISMALSLVAGLIPSRMAAKKDPVEALRSE